MDEGHRIVHGIPAAGGIATPEGRVGRLLRGTACSLQYLEMPAGLYMHEHAHPRESIVYTVRGRWVLCADGIREVVGPGSAVWFHAGLSKGYEVPFGEPALLLIFRPAADPLDGDAYEKYWADVASKMENMRDQGAVFRIDMLPAEHPARQFVKTLK